MGAVGATEVQLGASLGEVETEHLAGDGSLVDQGGEVRGSVQAGDGLEAQSETACPFVNRSREDQYGQTTCMGTRV